MVYNNTAQFYNQVSPLFVTRIASCPWHNVIIASVIQGRSTQVPYRNHFRLTSALSEGSSRNLLELYGQHLHMYEL